MSKKVLYIHIGWSKTGTSAVQAQLDFQFEQLKSQGILYSKAMQMNDHAHHHFALAFSPIHGYPAKYNVEQVLDILDRELDEHSCNSLLLSSELSPFYFNNPLFCNWVSRFDEVKVIATVRKQSELIISLYNQLVKDPQVRYKGSLFQLAVSTFPKVNYNGQMTKWSKKVNDENVIIIRYSNKVVQEFLSFFSLSVSDVSKNKIYNPSFPNEALLLFKEYVSDIDDAIEYRKVRDEFVKTVLNDKGSPKRILITKGEMDAIDNHFSYSNNLLCERYGLTKPLFSVDKRSSILAY